jgi:metal-responsive CopG/Arc/MetJ family transcriptional regulator
MDEIDRLIDVFPEHGYSSRADFIKHAVRDRIKELQQLESARDDLVNRTNLQG